MRSNKAGIRCSLTNLFLLVWILRLSISSLFLFLSVLGIVLNKIWCSTLFLSCFHAFCICFQSLRVRPWTLCITSFFFPLFFFMYCRCFGFLSNSNPHLSHLSILNQACIFPQNVLKKKMVPLFFSLQWSLNLTKHPTHFPPKSSSRLVVAAKYKHLAELWVTWASPTNHFSVQHS